MTRSSCRLRLFPVTDRPDTTERALPLIDALAARRAIGEEESGWTITYEEGDTSEAFVRCAAELDAIDPRWVEVLDFEALPARRLASRRR